METIAVVILATGSSHKITQETYNQILEAADNDYILLDDMTTFKKAAIMEILSIEDFENQHKEKVLSDYHQPYQDLKQLPALGYNGVIKQAKTTSHIEALARGLKKAKARFGDKPTPEIDKLLQLARDTYKGLKTEKGHEVKYKTWEEAKAAGVV